MRKLVITLFCIALLIPSRGNTLGLGEIELHSSLNEELNAEIVLTSVGQESAETIIVKLASREDFNRAGIDRPFILNDLKFAVKIKNGQPIIAVTSKKAIREPFLSFLIDIDWPRGHILREFTMLLDPPVFMQATPEGVPAKTVVAPQSANTVAPDQGFERPGYTDADTRNTQAVTSGAPVANAQQQYQAPVTATTQSRPLTSAQIARSYQIPSDAYRVQKGDTAWKIAEKLRANSSVSVEQMMMALLRRNPEAFIKDNINGVKRGYILRMPNQQETQSLDNQTALLQVKEQYALWREYREARIAKRTGNKIDRAGSSEGTTKSDQDAGQGRLTIASAAEKEGSIGMTSGSQNPEAELKQLRKDLAATTEELESGKLENNELKDRIASLQTRMKKMERLLNLKDGDLAKLQSDLDPVSDATAPVAPEMSAETAEMSPSSVDMKTEEMAESADAEPMTPAGVTEPEVADMTAPEEAAEMDAISSTQPAEDAVFKDEMDAMQTAPQQPAVVPQLPPADIGQKPKSSDLLTDFINDPDSLPLIIGIPVSVLLLVLFIIIRRKKAKSAEEPVANLPETGDFNFDEVADLVGDEGDFNDAEEQDLSDKLDAFAEEAEADAEMDFDESAEDVISLDEDQPAEEEAAKDDVLAEADVYLAYGIYQQAEELLKTAVAENPDRDDYKVKLLETYFASKDKPSFNSLAENLKGTINNESPDWQRVAAMGRELDSGNALFNESGDVPNFDVDDLIPQKPETDFDLGDAAADFDLGDAIDESSDFDLGLDDESLDDEIDATVALSAEEASSFDVGDAADEGTDNFALNDEGLDELDQELADAGIDDSVDEMEFGLDEVAAEPEAPVEEIDDSFSLDFEMADLGLDEADAEVSVEETEAIASSLEPDTENMGLDLAAGDDIPDMPEESADLEMDLGDLDVAIDEPLSEDLTTDDVSLDMGDIDLGDIDLSADLTDDAAPADDEINLDMGDIDLADDDDATIVRSMPEEDDEPIDISSLPDDLDEVNTKLDLARAYIDMGDSDGASDILREVIEEAAGDQKATAEDLLKNIA